MNTVSNFLQFVIHLYTKMVCNLIHTCLDVSHICFHITDLNLYPLQIIFEITAAKALPLRMMVIIQVVNAAQSFQATLASGRGLKVESIPSLEKIQ
jgi:hypothetical protein